MKNAAFVILLVFAKSTIIAQPPAKHWEGIAFNQKTNEFAVFSGAEFGNNSFSVTDSLWLFTSGKWKFIDNNDIEGRWAHALVYHNDDLYTYGGMNLDSLKKEKMLNDLHVYKEGRWKSIGNGPLLNLQKLFSSGNRLVLLGQSVTDQEKFELWELSDSVLKHKATFDLGITVDGFSIVKVKDKYMIGYPSDSGYVIASLQQKSAPIVLKNLAGISKTELVYNDKDNCYFLFGGMKGDKHTGILWRIKDGMAIPQEAGPGPSARASARMVPTASGFILYGGQTADGKMTNELWFFENGKWRKAMPGN